MKPRKVLLVGGGTAGSVMPLVALHEEIKERTKNQTKFLFIGSKNGIEKEIASYNKIAYSAVCAGKIRRYFDVRNIFTPFFVFVGFFQSLFILKRFKPDVILMAGSFIAIPVSWASKVLKIPLFVHQQDIRKTLSNTLTTFAAEKITVALKPSLKYFPKEKTVHVGNPFRQSILGGSREKAYELFGFRKDLPILLVIGGGTGALSVNELITESLSGLAQFVQVVHLTGRGKKLVAKRQNYFPFEFLRDELRHVYAAADLVITRAGMSTITELAALNKTIIIVPMPKTHQEDNAYYFQNEKAATIIDQASLHPEKLVSTVRDFILNPEKKREMGRNLHKLFPPNATQNYADLIETTLDEVYVRKSS